MYKYLLILLFSTLLFAKNPYPFSALGDVIYNNVNKVENLKKIDDISKIYGNKIDKYVGDVQKVKEEGFALENSSKHVSAKKYLNDLRQLAKEYDFFKRTVNTFYKKAKEKSNSKLFSQVINSGLVDTKKHKKEIINYYFAHQEDMNTTGIIQSYLDEDAKLRAKKEAQMRRYKSKKAREAERIRYLREQDRLEKERLERKLQKELKEKKEEIRKYQQKELSKTI